jgi:hypothetical protein
VCNRVAHRGWWCQNLKFKPLRLGFGECIVDGSSFLNGGDLLGVG